MKRLHAGTLVTGLVLFFAASARYAQAQILECEFCRFCDLFVVIHNAFDFFALQVTAPIATLMFIIGGLILMFGGSNPQLLTRAKTVLRATIIGTLIVLFSWIIVNTTINIITNSDSVTGNDSFWPWDSPGCTEVGAGSLEDNFYCDTCGGSLSDVLVGTPCTKSDGTGGQCVSGGGGGANNHCGCQ